MSEIEKGDCEYAVIGFKHLQLDLLSSFYMSDIDPIVTNLDNYSTAQVTSFLQ